MYLITSDARYAEYVRRQWDASLAGVRRDGSVAIEAERGSSAIHYTGFEIGLLIGLAEIANITGENLYLRPNISKLHASVSFHLGSLEDWDTILGYARADVAGITDDWKIQDFRYTYLWGPAYRAYMARFPAHENTQRMQDLVLDSRTCQQDPRGRPKSCVGAEDPVEFLELISESNSFDQTFLRATCIYPDR